MSSPSSMRQASASSMTWLMLSACRPHVEHVNRFIILMRLDAQASALQCKAIAICETYKVSNAIDI